LIGRAVFQLTIEADRDLTDEIESNVGSESGGGTNTTTASNVADVKSTFFPFEKSRR
jgi:hypothetical protein